jgi:hypothetical protein
MDTQLDQTWISQESAFWSKEVDTIKEIMEHLLSCETETSCLKDLFYAQAVASGVTFAK